MHVRFSAFLTVLLWALFVDAHPVSNVKRGRVTLPLKRVPHQSSVHPLINRQLQTNRGLRRLARMSGQRVPTDDELSANLRKRILSIDDGLVKRYNRIGVPGKSSKSNSKLAKLASSSSVLAAGDAGSDPLDGVTPANQPTANDSLGLNIEGPDIGYVATVQLGTPPRDFSILMDSGSADLWVGAENCKSQAGGGCGNHVFLGPQSSSTFKDTKKPFQVTYGTGSVSGDIVQDKMSVAGLQIKAHTFGVAKVESVEFSDNSTPFDGLMGLAQSTLSEQQTLTPIEAMAKQGLVQEAVVSYKISRQADNKNDGEITFGGLDDTKFDPQSLVELDNISKEGFWEATMDAVSVDGKSAGIAGRSAILDTGTTLILAPLKDAETLHNQIAGSQSDGQGGFSVPCGTNTSIALTFGKTPFAIDSRDIVQEPLDPNNPNGDCLSGIVGSDIDGAGTWLVGDVFLKNAYFSTNVGKNTLSLAKLV